jgi:hypothetical protein
MNGAILAGGAAAGEERGSGRRPGFRAAGAAASRIVAPIVARHGGGVLARLKCEWAAIVGPQVAAVSWPESLARGGTLKLRVAPARALEIQHRAPLVVERINLFFGRDAVVRLALVQGPLPLAALAAAPLPDRPLTSVENAALGRQIEPVASPELREALDRLGRRVIARE